MEQVDLFVPQHRVGCVYKKQLGCEVCTHTLMRECSKFREAHVKACAASLMPFTFRTIKTPAGTPFVPDNSVVYSYIPIPNAESAKQLYINSQYRWLADRLKSMAVRVAVSKFGGSPVEYETLETVVGKCFSYNRETFDFTPGVHFIELFSKCSRESKILTMVDSFISHVTEAGGRVFLLSSCYQPVVYHDWYELPVPRLTSVPSAPVASAVVSAPAGDSTDPHDEY